MNIWLFLIHQMGKSSWFHSSSDFISIHKTRVTSKPAEKKCQELHFQMFMYPLSFRQQKKSDLNWTSVHQISAAIVLGKKKLRCLGWSNSAPPKAVTFMSCKESKQFYGPTCVRSYQAAISLTEPVKQQFELETAHQNYFRSVFRIG